MTEILQNDLPYDVSHHRALPGVSPLAPEAWLIVDEAYSAQIQLRETLLTHQRDKVLRLAPEAFLAAQELLEMALGFATAHLGFERHKDRIICPDGRMVLVDDQDPLATLGRALQNDFCLLQPRGAEHILTGAILCFPASWTLAEKFMRPLSRIHVPVPSYDANITKRVQRLFNGIQVGRPLWRCNYLHYDAPDLFHPRIEADPRSGVSEGAGPYIRSERQTLCRLPETGAVVFGIHTFVLRNQAYKADKGYGAGSRRSCCARNAHLPQHGLVKNLGGFPCQRGNQLRATHRDFPERHVEHPRQQHRCSHRNVAPVHGRK